MSKKKTAKRLKRGASKLPRWCVDIGASKNFPWERRAQRIKQLGTFGAASEVRHIDPREYEGGKA